jgi:imidazole glycerol-phosphate synthase subunit HisH
MTVTIIDYGMGNLGSIANMLKQLGVQAMVSADPAQIEQADRLILAGVGAFDAGMQRLKDMGLIPSLEHKVLDDETPFLGICLGMQLLTRCSEEGQLPGLGWIEAETVKFRFEAQATKLRVPHMGWNEIEPRTEHPLLANLGAEPRFYFVHSYYARCFDANDVLATTEYGLPFHSIIGRGNVLGTQFHPEKSHHYGKKILENFVGWKP